MAIEDVTTGSTTIGHSTLRRARYSDSYADTVPRSYRIPINPVARTNWEEYAAGPDLGAWRCIIVTTPG